MMASPTGAGSSSLDRLDSALIGVIYSSEILTKITDDWEFLRKFWEFIHKGSGHAATDVEKKNMQFCLEIEATAEEIDQELIRFREEKMVHNNRVEDEKFLYKLAHDCGTKTKRLFAEAEEALDWSYLMWSRCRGSSSSFVLDVFFCTYLLRYVQSTVSAIEIMAANHWDYEDPCLKTHFYSLYYSVRDIEGFLVSLFDFSKSMRLAATTDHVLQRTHYRYHGRGLPSVDACLGHVLSVALRIANRCSDYWINCKAGGIQVMRRELIEFLVNLHTKIYPRNPKFVGFHLNFLMVLCCTGTVRLYPFCDYLFSDEEGHFRDEVFSLLELFIYTIEALDDEDTTQS